MIQMIIEYLTSQNSINTTFMIIIFHLMIKVYKLENKILQENSFNKKEQ